MGARRHARKLGLYRLWDQYAPPVASAGFGSSNSWPPIGTTRALPSHLTIGRRSTVKPAVWKAAGVADMGGCLCIGCLEKRIGRTLVLKDFNRNHPFYMLPGTERLLNRRDGAAPIGASRDMG